MNNTWIVKPKPNPNAKLKLICLPFAGGGSNSFRSWAPILPDPVELVTVEIPGRGQRLSEPLRKRIDHIIPEMASALIEELDTPFALFGHSMGTLLGFELAHHLREQFGVQPVHLFVSGRGAPHTESVEPPIHQLGHDAFIAEIKRFNGTPKAVLENQELMELMVPILRADFEACETYEYRSKAPFDFPITVFGGLQDKGAPKDRLEAWAEHTKAVFNIRMFPGDHFYLLNQTSLLIESILRDINYHFPLY